MREIGDEGLIVQLVVIRDVDRIGWMLSVHRVVVQLTV